MSGHEYCWEKEKDLRRWLVKKLKENAYFIEVRTANLVSDGLDDYCRKYYQNLGVLGSEVDVVLTTKRELIGIELEYIRPGDKLFEKLQHSIGQALLFLMIGFHKVGLLHFFHPDISKEIAENCATLIRDLFKNDLPDGTAHTVNYLCVRVIRIDENRYRLDVVKSWPDYEEVFNPLFFGRWLLDLALPNCRHDVEERRRCLKVALKAPIR